MSPISFFIFADGLISLVFGVAIFIVPYPILRTAFDLQSAGATGTGESLVESTFRSLSGFYMFRGAIQVVLAPLPEPYRSRLCAVIALHHAFEAIRRANEASKPWLTGTAWSDVAIHGSFATGYAAYLGWRVMQAKIKTT